MAFTDKKRATPFSKLQISYNLLSVSSFTFLRLLPFLPLLLSLITMKAIIIVANMEISAFPVFREIEAPINPTNTKLIK